MHEDFLYVAQGKIHLKQTGKPAQIIDSKFGQSLVDRASQISQRNAWKTQGTGAKFMSGGMLWGRQSDDESEIPVVINAVSRGRSQGEILYSLSTHEIGGIFSVFGSDEKRLLHTADFRVGQLSAHPSEDKVACTIRTKGASHLAVMHADGSGLIDVTQGDSLDANPHWIPNASNELLFQSTGIARNAAGEYAGLSSSRVERLNIDTGNIAAVLGDDTFDYLDPKMDSTGTLYCVRKPYVSPKQSFNPLRAALDLLLLPFRLLFAIFQFANFFTMRYTGNTLVSSGGVRQKSADLRHLMIMDNLSHALRPQGNLIASGNDWKTPKSWTLIKRTAQGEITVLEKGVLTFDLFPNGAILFSDGKRVMLRDVQGVRKELLKDEFISQVLAFPSE